MGNVCGNNWHWWLIWQVARFWKVQNSRVNGDAVIYQSTLQIGIVCRFACDPAWSTGFLCRGVGQEWRGVLERVALLLSCCFFLLLLLLGCAWSWASCGNGVSLIESRECHFCMAPFVCARPQLFVVGNFLLQTSLIKLPKQMLKSHVYSQFICNNI